MLDPRNLRAVEDVLRALGLRGSSVAMRQMVYAVALAHEDMQLLTSISKGLYGRVAEAFGTSNGAVERNLRTLRDRHWEKGNVDRLREMAMFPLKVKPSTGEFIDIVRYYMEGRGLFPDG